MIVKRLTLFVTGTSSRTSQAIESVRTLCLDETIELLIVDILVSPEIAETEKVFATPMLVRTEPPPKRRLVGDLKDRELIKHRLDLNN
jgi:circadian clock protein KaiB